MCALVTGVQTCALPISYLYSTYEAPTFGEPECEANPSERKKVVILGGGPNRIGQGIEFDYCCCHACFALEEAGYETIMVNCNPETVSTDYDTSDRSEEHTSELQSLMRISYAVFCLKKKKQTKKQQQKTK